MTAGSDMVLFPQAYQYSQLSHGANAEDGGHSIRYLVLHAGSADDPLECTLQTVSMAEATYEAVSYVWGSDVRDQQIICDGRSLAITTNLFKVLKRVRQPDATRSIWADLICIDQDNLDEKVRGLHELTLILRKR